MKKIEWFIKIITIVSLSILYFGDIDSPLIWYSIIAVNLLINIFVVLKNKKVDK